MSAADARRSCHTGTAWRDGLAERSQQLASINARSWHPLLEFQPRNVRVCWKRLAQVSELALLRPIATPGRPLAGQAHCPILASRRRARMSWASTGATRIALGSCS